MGNDTRVFLINICKLSCPQRYVGGIFKALHVEAVPRVGNLSCRPQALTLERNTYIQGTFKKIGSSKPKSSSRVKYREREDDVSAKED